MNGFFVYAELAQNMFIASRFPISGKLLYAFHQHRFILRSEPSFAAKSERTPANSPKSWQTLAEFAKKFLQTVGELSLSSRPISVCHCEKSLSYANSFATNRKSARFPANSFASSQRTPNTPIVRQTLAEFAWKNIWPTFGKLWSDSREFAAYYCSP
jgi:hypothetical protein